MRLFIAGATGVLGRRVVHKLLAAGHEVVGLSRSPQNKQWLAQAGAISRRGDLFESTDLADITRDCDAILHLATSIPEVSKPRLTDWALNDRIRRQGTQTLLDVARGHGCEFYLQQSVTFIYGDHDGAWVDESTPIFDHQPLFLQSTIDMERAVAEADQRGLPTITLRFGTFYSHDSVHTQTMLDMLQKRRFPVVGDGGGYLNLINVDDAADAVCAAVENHRRCRGATMNVCDDHPVTHNDLTSFVAEQLGASPPPRIPRWMGRMAMGGDFMDAMLASARCRNDAFKAATGWSPAFPTYKHGFPVEIERWLGRR